MASAPMSTIVALHCRLVVQQPCQVVLKVACICIRCTHKHLPHLFCDPVLCLPALLNA
jgi:hypothetical protein